MDVRDKDGEERKKDLGNIYKKWVRVGIDIRKEYMGVGGGGDYLCGGMKVDLEGEWRMKGVYGLGECCWRGLDGGKGVGWN